MKRLLAVLHARNMEFIRDRSALGWNILFPLLLVMGFALMFSGEPRDRYKVGVIGDPGVQHALNSTFFETDYVQFIAFDDLDAAIRKVIRHQLDMAIDVRSEERYWINSSLMAKSP